MKIRTGFVSNSSSSSFVVCYDPAKAEPTCTIEIDLNQFAEEVLRTEEQVNKYMQDMEDDQLEYWDAEEVAVHQEQWKKWRDAVRVGQAILICGVCNDDGDPMSAWLHDNPVPVSPNYTILTREW